MWPFGKKKIDLDELAMSLFKEGVEYQTPTVDGIYAYLEKSGQLQYRDEMTEKRILNMAAGVVAVELVLFQKVMALGPRSAPAKHDILGHYYGHVQRLADHSFAQHSLGIDDAQAMTMRLVHTAVADYPDHPDSPTDERLGYDLARAVMRLHVRWTGKDEYDVKAPNAVDDTNELSQAADGLARAQRWIETSLGKQVRAAMS